MSTLSCEDAVDRLPDWVAGRLGAGADPVAAHVAGCARCAAEADVLRVLLASRPAPPPDLASRIARAARAGSGSESGSRAAARPWRRVPAWALSAAAVLALAVGATTVLRDGAEPEAPALGEVAIEDDAGVWIAEDALVAGAPVLEELSDDDLAALLEEMGG